MGEQILEAISRRVQGRFSRADEEWSRCDGDLMTQARALAVCTVGWLLVIGLAAAVGLVFGPALA